MPDIKICYCSSVFHTGELTALVGIYDPRRSMLCNRFIQYLNAKISRQRIAQLPAKQVAAMPVDDRA